MRQLRGEKLKNAIREGIYALADKTEKSGKKYVYKASELTQLIGTSRVTLGAYSDFVDEVLTQLKAEKRVRTGKVLQQQLIDKIERLEADKKALEKEVNTLRSHHAEIYTRLLSSSKDIAILVASYVETVKDGKCLACNSVVGESKPIEPENVILMEKIKEQQKQRKKDFKDKYEDF